jgi:hypothetical protein
VGGINYYLSGGCPIVYLFRAVEKDTGQVIEVKNISSSSALLINVPVGRWLITNCFSQGNAYGELTYFLTSGNSEAITDATFYDDFTLYTAAVVLSGIPRMAGYDYLYCPFSRAIMSGDWSMSPVY